MMIRISWWCLSKNVSTTQLPNVEF
jgi:hypothetical protein